MNSTANKREKALQLMEQKGLGGLIVYSDGKLDILDPCYLLYFAGFRPLSRAAMVISSSGANVLLVEPQWDATRASQKSWASQVKGTSDLTTDLVKEMRELKIKGTVGLVGYQQATYDLYTAIGKEASIEPADAIIEEIARVRTADEVNIAKKAAQIADVGFKAFLEKARVGMREYELAAEVEYAMRVAGGDDNFFLLSSGKHNHLMHPPRDRKFTEGDILLGEISPWYEGQLVQLCRTVVLDQPSPVLVEKYNLLLHALDEALKTIKIGEPASGLAVAMNKVLSEAGYAEYCRPPYMRTRGHGVGIGSTAPGGLIDSETKTKLEKNNVLIVHPNQYIPETGYLACGETFIVTDAGVKTLAETETKLYVKEV